jgi:ribosome-associated translation inhibitor RaiA
MQVLLHTDPHTDGSQAMAQHLETEVKTALGRFGERVTRVEAHLSDADSATRSGPESIHCTLDARVSGLDPVVVKDAAASAHQAIDGALRKLKRAVGAGLSKQDSRRPHGPGDPLLAAPAIEPAA